MGMRPNGIIPPPAAGMTETETSGGIFTLQAKALLPRAPFLTLGRVKIFPFLFPMFWIRPAAGNSAVDIPQLSHRSGFSKFGILAYGPKNILQFFERMSLQIGNALRKCKVLLKDAQKSIELSRGVLCQDKANDGRYQQPIGHKKNCCESVFTDRECRPHLFLFFYTVPSHILFPAVFSIPFIPPYWIFK